MKTTPLSAYQETLGMMYFARMLDKARLHAADKLREDFYENLGTGLDSCCCDFLRVPYADLVKQVLLGGSDEDLLHWCFQNGRELSEGDCFIWNQYLTRVGWNDDISETLTRRKKESGLQHLEHIQTMLDYFEYDEGRRA